MTNISFSQALIDAIKRKRSYVCIGLDPNFDGKKCIPGFVLDEADGDHNEAIWTFNKNLVDATHDLAAVYKPQMAFYEKYQAHDALKKTIDYIHKKNGLVILDAKRNDIGNTSRAYVHSLFENFHADATTVNGYLGTDCLKPFMEYKDKGLFILVKTSNPSSVEFQDQFVLNSNIIDMLGDLIDESTEFITSDDIFALMKYNDRLEEIRNRVIAQKNYLLMADLVKQWSDEAISEQSSNSNYSNIGAVVGATFPKQLKLLRERLPDSIFLIPGFGAQGGTAKDIVDGFNDDKQGAVINSSRGIDYAYVKKIAGQSFTPEEYAEAARVSADEMRMSINEILEVN